MDPRENQEKRAKNAPPPPDGDNGATGEQVPSPKQQRENERVAALEEGGVIGAALAEFRTAKQDPKVAAAVQGEIYRLNTAGMGMVERTRHVLEAEIPVVNGLFLISDWVSFGRNIALGVKGIKILIGRLRAPRV